MTLARRAIAAGALAALAGGLLGATTAATPASADGTVAVLANCNDYLVQARHYYDLAADAAARGQTALAARYRLDGDTAMDRYRSCLG